MGVRWPQLGGSIRQLALLVSALGWVCPARQMSLSFLQERLGGQQAIGRGGKPCLATRTTFPGAQQAAGRPPLRTPATCTPGQLLESLRRCHPFLFPECCPPPERGGSTLCSRVWGPEASTRGT